MQDPFLYDFGRALQVALCGVRTFWNGCRELRGSCFRIFLLLGIAGLTGRHCEICEDSSDFYGVVRVALLFLRARYEVPGVVRCVCVYFTNFERSSTDCCAEPSRLRDDSEISE